VEADVDEGQETDVRVKEVHPWGLTVSIEGEADAFLDNTKCPDWSTSGGVPEIGIGLHVVVLDVDRTPIRVSALLKDIEIARRRRSG
jgi:hypothetical protein